ncbi:MAG: NAD(P)-dependent oxidoreductase [Alphaproteobacteria bacterium]|nr:NAD(P)-dependent oxidoreductase [Alphaproteobacteria bacterium]
MTDAVGLVGVGAMGSALLKRLHLAGHAVKAYDIAEGQRAHAEAEGAEAVSSPAEAAQGCEIIHVFVRTDDEAEDAVLGAGGVLEGAAAGALVLLHSTVMPETTQRIAAEAEKHGVTVIDAPVTAVPRVVAAGDAVFLLGGSAEAVSRARTQLEALGKGVWHFGPVGCGNVAKIAKNFINAAERVVLAETLNMVEAGGLDVGTFLEMAVAEDGGSTVSRWERAFEIKDNHAHPRPASNLMNKDVGLAAKLADQQGIPAPVARGAADTAAIWVAGWEADKA